MTEEEAEAASRPYISSVVRSMPARDVLRVPVDDTHRHEEEQRIRQENDGRRSDEEQDEEVVGAKPEETDMLLFAIDF